MLDKIFTTVVGESVTMPTILDIVGTALLLGLIISLTYIYTHRKDGYVPSFTITLIMLSAIISMIILLVGNNVARAFSLAGAFSLIRFRSAPGDPKDIAYIFFTLAVGLGCGIGFLAASAMFTIILCLVMILIYATKYGTPKETPMLLKITIPEDMNYQDLFDEDLKNYTTSYYLKRVKTTDFGSLFELVYRVVLKKDCDQKAFIDDLRKKNGNLNIQLTMREFEDRVYYN